MSHNFFAKKPKVRRSDPERIAKGMLFEDELGENIRHTCAQLGWHFYWLRKTINSSDGILDLLLVPTKLKKTTTGKGIMHRELKGHDARGRLGKASEEQQLTIHVINEVGGNAGLWVPADWFSGKILEELR